MNPRDTDRRESVVTEILGILGVGRAAVVIGKSESTLYEAGNERQSYMLPDEDFLALDVACVAKEGIAPFHRWWGRQIAKRIGAATREEQEVGEAVLDAGAAYGRLVEAVKAARCPNGAGGSEITPRERTAIKQATNRMRDECDDVDRAVGIGEVA